jgi:hypothetical protein
MTDILLDGSFDLAFADGDLSVGESTLQHQQLLLLSAKGEWREFPTRGVNLRSWLLNEQAGNLNGEIKREFTADGMTVKSVNARGGKINVVAAYE